MSMEFVYIKNSPTFFRHSVIIYLHLFINISFILKYLFILITVYKINFLYFDLFILKLFFYFRIYIL